MNNEAYKSSAAYMHNYIEYSVRMKTNTSLFIKKLLIIMLAIVLAFTGIVIFVDTIPSVIVVYFIIIGIGVWYLWRYVNIEYEYVIVSGEFSMDIIYGKRKRKRLYTFKIKEAEVIVPLSGENYKKYVKCADKIHMTASGLKSQNAYLAIYIDNCKKQAAIFDVTKRTLDVLKYYNRNTCINENITL